MTVQELIAQLNKVVDKTIPVGLTAYSPERGCWLDWQVGKVVVAYKEVYKKDSDETEDWYGLEIYGQDVRCQPL